MQWPLMVLGAAAIGVLSWTQLQGMALMFSLLLGMFMLAIARSDITAFRIPDVLSLPAILLGLLGSGRLTSLGQPALIEPLHIVAAIAGAGTLWLVRIAYRSYRKRDGLGLGDVKLAAVAGAWTGLEGVSSVLLLACGLAIAGIIVLRVLHGPGAIEGTTAIPFGAALAPAIWIVWFVMATG